MKIGNRGGHTKTSYGAVGVIDEKYLIQAIKLGWITEEEKSAIMGTTSEVPIEDAPTVIPEIYKNGIQ